MVKNEEVIHDAIKDLVKASQGATYDGALRFSQAALNLAHTLATLSNIPK